MHGRRRSDQRAKLSFYVARREWNRKNGKAKQAIASITGKHTPVFELESMTIPAAELAEPISDKGLHLYLTDKFSKAFTFPVQPPDRPVDMVHGGLSWEQVKDWEVFRRVYAHLEVLNIPLRRFW